MPAPSGTSVATALMVAIALLAAGCSSDDGGSASTTTTDATRTEPVRTADRVTGPVEGGAGINRPQPAIPPPDGYVEEEFFVGGEAVSYEPVGDLAGDGRWDVDPVEDASPYATRVIVRRPADPAAFSGTVIVEWLNVTAIEASPDWAYLSPEVARAGHVFVAASVQQQGVTGGETLLDPSVDAEEAEAAGGTDEVDNSGLVNIDPERYRDLTHPGDAYALDIFSQIGRALVDEADLMLSGLSPEQVIGAGQSQSAFFLTTYANAVQPLAGVYDGLMIHSRGAGAAPLGGTVDRGEGGRAVIDEAVHIRTDLGIPVFQFEAETDLTRFGFANARQPDTDRIVTWEVAGTAHSDAHQFRAILGGPRDPTVGSIIGCDDPINVGPHHETYQAAMDHLVRWAAGGPEPPPGDTLDLEDGDEIVIARDARGIALGGIRTPLVDAPVAALTGEPPEDSTAGGGLCALFGTTTVFDRATLLDLHGSPDGYVAAFTASADDAVEAGHLLRADADVLVAEAEENRALFG